MDRGRASSSFGLYGLAKKRTKADPFTSLAGEMLMLLPVLSLLEWWLFTQGRAVWFSAEPQQMVRSLGGRNCDNCAPALFSASAKRLPLGGGAHAIHRPHSAIHVGGGVFW